MKSVSVIDKAFSISEPNKILKELTNANNLEKFEEFKKAYIIPYLKEKNIEMPDGTTLIENWKKVNDYTMGFIKRWMDGYIRKYLEKKFNYLNHQKIMPNMTKFGSKIFDIEDEEKKLLGVMFAEFTYKLTTFETKSNEYLNEYIIPILETKKEIVFDLSSTDENVKLITQRTIDLFLKYIHEQGSMTFHNSIFEGNSFEDIEALFNYFNFLYIDEIEMKKTIANLLCEVFVDNYEKIDLTQKPNSNIRYLYLAVPSVFLEDEEL